jgi:tetratricopeptide (TPR) repeat protein
MESITNYQFSETDLLEEVGKTAYEWGDYQLAQEMLESAVDKSKDESVSFYTQFSRFHHLALATEKLEELEISESYYKKAFDLVVKNLLTDHPDLIPFLDQFALFLRKKKMSKIAEGMGCIAEIVQRNQNPEVDFEFDQDDIDLDSLELDGVAEVA